jgi:two-component system chemotaxis response regulator CheB
MIKLLIVDDSALMRRQLGEIFAGEGDFDVQMVRNGAEALEANLRFQPDVVTLDINMPEMDGLTALSRMMLDRPVPVVMVSSLTEQGALATFEALNLGAVDYITKPGGTISLSIGTIRGELVAKVRAAAHARLRPQRTPGGASHGSRARDLVQRMRDDKKKAADERAMLKNGIVGAGVVLIGVSTGGPRTLEEILPAMPADFPWPVLIAQHMPATFTGSFADRLDQICPLRVVEAANPLPLEPGTIYLGKGGADMVLSTRAGRLTVLPKPESPQYLWHPSVELLGRSALENCNPAQVIGVMLTGMGNDGSLAFTELRKRGGRTIAESEESAVVFGMPKELIDLGGATVVLAADRVVAQLLAWVGR